MAERPDATRALPRPAWRAFAALLAVVGTVFLIGGGWLVMLGGSAYYALAGLGTLAAGIMAWRGSGRARLLYAAVVIGTLAWSAWEIGLDGWALLPRVFGPFLLGLGFLGALRKGRSLALFALAAVLAFVGGWAAHVAFNPPLPDPMFQAGYADALPAPLPFAAADDRAAGEWRHYGNDPGGMRFSPLDQISAANVADLEKAWETHVGPAPEGLTNGLQATPLKVGNSLYTCTGYNDVLSLDAETGRINWRFKSGIDMAGRPHGTCRGVAFHEGGGNEAAACARRIVTNTTDARLIALDAATGRPCPGFGEGGTVDLNRGMGDPDLGYYYVSSAPTIVNGRVVVGGWVSDGQHWGEPSGVIRAYDVMTGQFAWAFDVGRPDRQGEPAEGETYTRSTPNSWAPMSADPDLGLVYAPTGNATPDYYGAQRRSFDDQYSSAVVAIDVATGRLRWVYQTVHHDLWDYDVASQPTLVDVPIEGRVRKALVQPTKRGEIFVLDRVTGRPLAEVVERAAPSLGAAPGERIAPMQPFSTGVPAFSGPPLQERDMWGISALDQMWCRIQFRRARYDGTMTPPGLTPWISYPGYLGGVDWGGVSVDADRSIVVVNSNRMANYNVLLTRAEADGLGVAPSKGGSPRAVDGVVAQANTPFAARIKPFLSPLDVPCNRPPYGLISAFDLRSGKLLWSHPLGTAEDSGPFGIRSGLPLSMGLPNLGGAVTTRGGLVFLSATQSPVLRAFDIRTGEQVWQARLPAGGQATPLSYWSEASGRQFIAISAGGSPSMRSPRGDSIVAYALPNGR